MQTCNACGATFEAHDSTARPGDIVGCPKCAAPVLLADSVTVAYGGAGPGSLAGTPDDRPQQVAEGQVLPPGTVIGSYRIEKLLGRGGMGAVYKAQHLSLQRSAALKLLPPNFSEDPEFVERFRREALALASLSHPNIVAVHDMGTQGKISWLAMEYVDGPNLRDVLRSGKMPPEEALKIVPALCAALEYAHGQGVIHRDIKPENILLDRAGTPKIADFGLAKIVKGDSAPPPLTHTNVIMGTVEYMAPEQRDRTKGVDHRADIYSMGVVLYEMLTGDLPVGRFAPVSKKYTLDVRLDDVVLKALDADPALRYQRASQLGTDVSRIAEAPTKARRPAENWLAAAVSSITPKTAEKLGVFVIVGAGLWLLFRKSGCGFVPTLYFLIGGMVVGTRIWKDIVAARYGIPRAATAAAPAGQAAAMPPPAAPTRQFSGWAGLSIFGFVLGILGTVGALFAAAAGRFPEILGPEDLPEASMVLVTAGWLAALVGTGVAVLGMATIGHVREFRARLKGGWAGWFALVSGVACVVVAGLLIFPRVEEIRKVGAEVHEVRNRIASQWSPSGALDSLVGAWTTEAAPADLLTLRMRQLAHGGVTLGAVKSWGYEAPSKLRVRVAVEAAPEVKWTGAPLREVELAVGKEAGRWTWSNPAEVLDGIAGRMIHE